MEIQMRVIILSLYTQDTHHWLKILEPSGLKFWHQ